MSLHDQIQQLQHWDQHHRQDSIWTWKRKAVEYTRALPLSRGSGQRSLIIVTIQFNSIIFIDLWWIKQTWFKEFLKIALIKTFQGCECSVKMWWTSRFYIVVCQGSGVSSKLTPEQADQRDFRLIFPIMGSWGSFICRIFQVLVLSINLKSSDVYKQWD